jgi:multisubunit Na+/H+ antiporter MnhC subunit
MPLTKEQIDALFAFTEKKFVRYYDLQVELVDHLASSIEEEIENNATLSFEEALQKVYSSFGIFGFAHIVQEREKALWTQGWSLFWKTLRSHFSIPKVAFTALLFVSSYLLAPLLPGLVQRIVVMLAFAYSGFIEIRTIVYRRKTDVKPLLLTQAGNFFVPFPIWSGWIFSDIFNWKATQVHPIAFAVVFTSIVILHVTALQIDTQIRQKAKALYPEAFSVA